MFTLSSREATHGSRLWFPELWGLSPSWPGHGPACSKLPLSLHSTSKGRQKPLGAAAARPSDPGALGQHPAGMAYFCA